MPEKQYVNKCKIVEKEFDNEGWSGSVMNCAFNVDELQSMSQNGWVNITIAKRREPSEKGATHYAYKKEYKPKDSQTQSDELPF